MSEVQKITGSTIKYEGVFDWDELYALLKGWLNSKKYDFFETKHNKKPTTFGYEFEFELNAERDETTYVKFKLDIKIKSWNNEDFEVAVNGKKKRKTKTGMLMIDIVPTMELDYENDWEGGKENAKKAEEQVKTMNKLKKGLRTLMHKYILKKNIKDVWHDKLYYEAYKLQTKIKEELNMESKYSAYEKWPKGNY